MNCPSLFRYKREIDDLTRGTLLHHDGKLESREKIVPTTSIFSEKGLNPPWKDEYCRWGFTNFFENSLIKILLQGSLMTNRQITTLFIFPHWSTKLYVHFGYFLLSYTK